jgi:hypothetical protein
MKKHLLFISFLLFGCTTSTSSIESLIVTEAPPISSISSTMSSTQSSTLSFTTISSISSPSSSIQESTDSLESSSSTESESIVSTTINEFLIQWREETILEIKSILSNNYYLIPIPLFDDTYTSVLDDFYYFNSSSNKMEKDNPSFSAKQVNAYDGIAEYNLVLKSLGYSLIKGETVQGHPDGVFDQYKFEYFAKPAGSSITLQIELYYKRFHDSGTVEIGFLRNFWF